MIDYIRDAINDVGWVTFVRLEPCFIPQVPSPGNYDPNWMTNVDHVGITPHGENASFRNATSGVRNGGERLRDGDG